MSRINNSYYAILGILGFGSMSGYGIKSWVDKGISYFWDIDYKQIYPTLNRLVDSNLAVYKTEKNGKRPESKVYTLTESGLEELKRWLRTPISPGKTGKNELLLKLFFGHHISLEENLQHIRQFKQAMVQRLEALTEIEKEQNKCSVKEASWYYQRTTVLEGEIHCRSNIEWCDLATDFLEGSRRNIFSANENDPDFHPDRLNANTTNWF
jgi:DNA-binding PadR family transcriptional regulator